MNIKQMIKDIEVYEDKQSKLHPMNHQSERHQKGSFPPNS